MNQMSNFFQKNKGQNTSSSSAEASFVCANFVILLGIALAVSVFFVFVIGLLALIIFLVTGTGCPSERMKIPVAV